MNSKPQVVSYIGVIGSGKDYNAEERMADGYHRVDFKDGLIELVNDIVGYDVREDYDWFKSHLVGMRKPKEVFMQSFAHTDTRDFVARHPEAMTGRRLLQRLGTEGMRKRDPDYWAKQFLRKASATLAAGFGVVNADCRFPNEVVAIRRLQPDASFVFCNFKSVRYSATSEHESEAMAQALLATGLKDGQRIEPTHFNAAFQRLGSQLEVA
jgi:hypothetical protein